MKNPYKPLHRNDGKWYVGSRSGKSYWPSYGAHDSEAAVLIRCAQKYGHDCQAEIDKISTWLEANDPDYSSRDPHGWLA